MVSLEWDPSHPRSRSVTPTLALALGLFFSAVRGRRAGGGRAEGGDVLGGRVFA